MEKVLVIEDEKDTANALRRHLSEYGMNTEVVYDGNSAFELLRKNKYSGVVLDLSLPGDSPQGNTILEWLSKRRENIATVVVTAYTHLSERALELGVDTLLHKPVDGIHIPKYMQRAIELRKLRAENKKLRKLINLSITSYLPGAVLALLVFAGLFIWRSYLPDDEIGVIVATIIACIGLIGSKRVTRIVFDLSKKTFQIEAADRASSKGN